MTYSYNTVKIHTYSQTLHTHTPHTHSLHTPHTAHTHTHTHHTHTHTHTHHTHTHTHTHTPTHHVKSPSTLSNKLHYISVMNL